VSYQTLYRKHRPQRFADLVGQAHVTRTLQNAMRTAKLAHAYLFCGPRGTGKTTTARILAKALNCERLAAERTADPDLAAERFEPCNECPTCVDITRGVSFDVYEVDAASHRGIDDIRQITERAQQVATDPSRHSVFIIDEVHQLSRDGASAFLKTLEEPPANVVFVLATTDPEKMIPTILSRCQRFDFRPVPVAELAARLDEVCRDEGIEADEAALEAIARRARGGVRDALSSLEQARALCGDRIGAVDVVTLFGGLDTEDLALAYDAIAASDAGAVLRHVDELVRRGIDVRTYLRELIEWGRWVFLSAAAPGARDLVDLGDEAYSRAQAQGELIGPARATRALTVLGQAMSSLPQSLHPRIELETALVTLASPALEATPEALVARIEALERGAPRAGGAPRAERPDPPPVESPPPSSSAEPAGVPAPADPAPRPQPEPTAQPAPSASQAATGPAAPAAPGELTIAAVEAAWQSLVDTIKRQSPRSGAYFLGSRPVALDGDVVSASFAADFHREHATKSCQDVFAEAAEAVLGRPLRIAGVDGDAGDAAAGPGASEVSAAADAAVGEPAAEPEEDVADYEEAVGTRSSRVAPVDPLSAVVDLVTTELGGEVIADPEQP